jgi:hypothetical protein
MNEYLEAFNELQDKDTFRGQQWFGERGDLVDEYSWAVPNEDALIYLAEFDELVEVGAGSGYWANCINKAGGKVMPYDIDPPKTKDRGGDTWTHVERCAVEDMRDDCFESPVLMVWPALKEGVATTVAEREPPHILYVGEPRGGCTGEDEFFYEIERKYGLVAKIEIPSYAGIHDDLFHYVRKV